jgi:predicted nucleic acid-binding protein
MVTLIRAGKIDNRTAHSAFAEAQTAVINREIPVDQGQVMRLAIRFEISAYDAQYVALAEEYGVVCVTSDVALCERVPTRAMLLEEYFQGT